MKKIFLMMLVCLLFCTNIEVLAQEDATCEEEKIIYNEEYLISPYVASPDIRTISMTQTGVQIIPSAPYNGDLVSNAEVVYRFTYKITAITNSGQTVTDMPVQYISYTGPVIGSKFVSIDSAGTGYIYIDVRGVHAFTVYCHIGNANSNRISATPTAGAVYESSFYCTGYITALESDYTGSKVSVAGISDATFIDQFVAAVKLNGSGKASSGKYLHYNASSGTFSYMNPTTATGTTPVAGRTIAVDPYYIPRAKVGTVWKRATVDISGVGRRAAEDGGGAIKGYRIDVYRGIGKAAMVGWSNGNKTVTLVSVN